MKHALFIIAVLFFISCGGSGTSSSTTGKYTFTSPVKSISYQLMGVATDGSQRAGVDPASMITPNGQVRLIFSSNGGVWKSALSTDGKTFTLDSNFNSSGPFSTTGIGHPTIVASPTGGFRMFGRSDLVVYSATSTDGASWTQESGTRFDASTMGQGFTRITGPSVSKLPDGRYRMYFSPEVTNCYQSGVTSFIYSATSTDQINWTADSGVRLGSQIDSHCMQKPSAITESDGSTTLFYHVYSRSGEGVSWSSLVYYSNSSDGMTFTSETSTGVGLTSPTSGGLTGATDPNILRMPDGTMRLYFDIFTAPDGDQIYVAPGVKNY